MEFAERGTVVRAAQVLGYTPSAVSQQLAALTKQAGTPLTRHVGRGLVLTPAGTALAASAVEVLDAVERAHVAVSQRAPQVQGSVNLAVFQSAALALLPGALDILDQRAPELRVHVTQVEPEQALKDTWARDYDVVVAEEYPHHRAPLYRGLVREDLGKDTIHLCTSHTGIAAHATSVADCADFAWVMEPAGTASRHYAEQACRTAGFEPDVRYETSDLQAHLALVESGHAVALMTSLLIHASGPRVRMVDPSHNGTNAGERAQRTVFAAMRESSTGEAGIGVLLTALRESAKSVESGRSLV